MKDPHYDENYIDPLLTAEGKKQCEENNCHLPGLKAIMISPSRAALDTAFSMFCEHPNFEYMKFLIMPDLRERMQYSYSIPNEHLNNTLKDFREAFIEQRKGRETEAAKID